MLQSNLTIYYRARSKGDNMFGSVRPSVCICSPAWTVWPLTCILHYAHAAEWSIYGLGLQSAKENHHDTWHTVQDLCAFVSGHETFAIKCCTQRSGAFNLKYTYTMYTKFYICRWTEKTVIESYPLAVYHKSFWKTFNSYPAVNYIILQVTWAQYIGLNVMSCPIQFYISLLNVKG